MGYIIVLHKRKKKGREDKRDKRGNSFYSKVCSSDRKNAGIIVFHARGRGKEPFLLMWKGVAGEILLLTRDIVCEMMGIEKVYA